jgi:CRP/FNR family transcriptional regulator
MESCCHTCQHKSCAKKVPIFSELEPKELVRVTDLIIRKTYVKGEMLMLEDEVLDRLVIINEGKVKAFRYTQEGKEQILYIFSRGDFFGEKNLLRKQEVTYNIEALETTHVCMIPNKSFKELLAEIPEISFKIIDQLCNRMDQLEGAIQNMGSKSVEARVSAALIEFADKYGRPHAKGIVVILPLSREGIANYIGVTRESVSRKMSYLQEAGIIEMIGNKKVIILDKKRLEEEMQKP